jgi:hypothetical protein
VSTNNTEENLNPGQTSSFSFGYYINVGNIVWFQATIGITGTAGLTSTSSVFLSIPVNIGQSLSNITQYITVNMGTPNGVTNAFLNLQGGGGVGVNFNGGSFKVSQINNPFVISYSGCYFIN